MPIYCDLSAIRLAIRLALQGWNWMTLYQYIVISLQYAWRYGIGLDDLVSICFDFSAIRLALQDWDWMTLCQYIVISLQYVSCYRIGLDDLVLIYHDFSAIRLALQDRAGWPCVNILRLGETTILICGFYLRVAARESEEFRP